MPPLTQNRLSSLPPPPKGQVGVTFGSLSSLPPPPKGQVGVTFGSLSSLPPPPKGQTEQTLEQITASQPSLPTSYQKATLPSRPLPGADMAVISAKPAGSIGSGFVDFTKIVPNALGDIWNLVKEGTYGTAKKIFHDIPVEAYNLVKEQGLGNALKNTVMSIPGAVADVGTSLIPQSVKELANTDALAEIPNQFRELVKQNGGSYSKALLAVVKEVPGAIPDAVSNYANQIDRARQSVENHPVNEFLGYMGLKAFAEHPVATVKSTVDALNTTKEFVQSPIESIKSAYNTDVKPAVTNFLNTVKNKVSSPQTSQGLAGTITQGKIADKPASVRTLSNIDSSKVKTYQDLSSSIDTQVIKPNVTNQDTFLSQSTGVKTLPELTNTTKVGNSTITHNFVADALKQLDALYKKVNDPVMEQKILDLKTKAETTGLNATDVNNLARLHGKDLSGFNASGEASTGLTKQAAENTRTGLKTTAGEMSGDPTQFKTNDKTISDAIKTKDLVDNVTEKVNDLKQKIQPRGIGERFGRIVGNAINIIGLNSPKGLIEYFLGRGTGLKTLNALDLESALQKNLLKLQDIVNNKNLSVEEGIRQVQDIINSQSRLNHSLKEGESIQPTTEKTKPNIPTKNNISKNFTISSKDTTLPPFSNPSVLKPRGITVKSDILGSVRKKK